MVTNGCRRQIPRVHSRRQSPGLQGVARTGRRDREVGAGALAPSCARIWDSPCSPAPARCGRPLGLRSSVPACCWRWWPAQTRWWGPRTVLGEKGAERSSSGPRVDPAVEGVEWGLRRETGHGPQIANYSATMMPLAPECCRCCFWLQISLPVIPPQTNVRMRLHFLPA